MNEVERALNLKKNERFGYTFASGGILVVMILFVIVMAMNISACKNEKSNKQNQTITADKSDLMAPPLRTQFVDINAGVIVNEPLRAIGDMYPVYVLRVQLDHGGMVPVLVGSYQDAEECMRLAKLKVPINVRCESYGYGDNLPYTVCTFLAP